ncbi:hypothetical protein P4O66_023110 [Electrophorus voltai]|uniref:Uncharacterized protein n=1 Tax=Electrophorus voltai TaxID=2609070 RepID=A0AAD9DJY0_9TELE|nr:hypothetical protein P4O66_023110 [Electrophorus voltai]
MYFMFIKCHGYTISSVCSFCPPIDWLCYMAALTIESSLCAWNLICQSPYPSALGFLKAGYSQSSSSPATPTSASPAIIKQMTLTGLVSNTDGTASGVKWLVWLCGALKTTWRSTCKKQ